MKPLLDRNHPAFRHSWVRVATVVVPCLWAAVEFWQGAPFWGVLFAGLGLYAGWELYLRGSGK